MVVRGRRADQLDVDPLGVHPRQACGDVGEQRDALAHHGTADGQCFGPVAAGVQGLRLGQAGPVGDEGFDLGQQQVGVDVDSGGRQGRLVHGSSLRTVMVRPIRPGTSASRTPSISHWPIWQELSTTMRTRGRRRAW